ncbi:hypothetical protein [Serinibacter arcticus]|uniref:Uncharacterized protein n=1 Tax=Serinibacter arcticus TaxID=1655435 RepID=A0A4Z1DWE9_9MICO|nr:hypothetical protein [Serinibacter arcticus]TGO03925.1 hypothetical protein SERN_2937 [Serinibacter arcticus]
MLAVVVAAGLAACTPDAGPTTGPPTTTPVASEAPATLDPAASALADDLAVEIVQTRLDWGRRVLSLVVSAPDDAGSEAGANAELTVVAAALDSPGWDGTRATDPDRTVTVGPGRTRSMFVTLGDARCDPRPDGATSPGGVARLTLAPGVERDVTVTDPYGHLARAWGEDCARLGAEAAVALTIGPDVVAGTRDGVATGTVSLTVTPLERPAQPVVVTGVRGSQLLAPLGGAVGWSDPALAAPAPAGSTVALPFTAVRCDRHAIAEDKRGTYLGIETSRDGVAQPLFHVRLPEATRSNLLLWYADACGWEG